MYQTIQKLKDPLFRRKTGVKRQTFTKMVEIVQKSELARKKLSGRPLKLSYENQVLMTLEYLREYQTYFSIAQIYDLSEANTYSDRYRNRRKRFGLRFNLIAGLRNYEL